ncbi:MAG: hypothetical protein HZC28_09670 [Spirochaetes bacterium]|nr:hypothetical protein [Spirochaetota bacterium]
MLVINDALAGKKLITEANFNGINAIDLKVSEPMTVSGKEDRTGMAMAIILDTMLGKGFEPDGFVQGNGYRIYHYKRMR